MKKALILALLFCAGFSPVSGASKSAQDAPDYYITIEELILGYTNDYMNAQSVRVDLLDGSGNVQATATTQPGHSVSFQLNDASRKLRTIYYMDSGQTNILIEDINPG